MPHVLFKTSHIHLQKARAGGKRNFWSHRKFPLDFNNLYRYLAFLKFDDSVVYRFTLSGCKVAVFVIAWIDV